MPHHLNVNQKTQMSRLILLIWLIGVCDGRCDLVNTQSAANDLFGIKISRVEKANVPTDELPVVVTYDHAKVGPILILVVRDKEFKKIGEFEYSSQVTGTKAGMGQARFSLNPEFLYLSFLKTKSHLIPLSLYFDDRGKSINESNITDIKPTSPFSIKVWPVRLSFYKTQLGKASKKGPDAKIVFSQSKTQEQLFRSWGLVPPVGTEFYPGGGKAAVVIRSTKEFLNELESELEKRNFLAEDKKREE